MSQRTHEILLDALGATRPGELANAVERALNGSASFPAADLPRARAMSLLLDDLRTQTWSVCVKDAAIWVMPPHAKSRDGEALAQVKHRVRAGLLAAREGQLREPAVRAFIRKMETQRAYQGERVSVLDLVDDGHSLALALSEIAQRPPSERTRALERVVRPTVEVALPGTRCEHTGLALIDIWRYFRHTWSLEYRPTPGRTLLLLLRNAARPRAPIMGIASLANATLQLNARDRWIGWTTKHVIQRLHVEPDFWRPLRRALLRTLREARAMIRSDDLLARAGDGTGAALEERLLTLASVAASERERALKHRRAQIERGEEVASLRRLPQTESGEVDWKLASEAPLFVSKRAKTLANLSFAERVLSDTTPRPSSKLAERLNNDPDVNRALRIATREIRKVGLASRLLELNVCGAVPPYRELLVGKLVSLAAASAEVAAAYERRYREQVSEIASQMAGRAVARSPEICVITTTSLYGVASSQYNRLKVFVETQSGGADLVWRDLGLTEGFGTAHFGEQTVSALRELSTEARGNRHVNNVFGEGQSPRLRQVREGLDVMGLESEALLRHGSQRRVYGLDLFADAREALCLNRSPRGEFAPFASIATAWTARWLSRRIMNRDVLARVRQQGPSTVKAELEVPHDGPQEPLFPVASHRGGATHQAERAPPERAPPRMVIMNKQSNPRLIQTLYRAISTCADHHDEATLAALHIETPVERFIQDHAPGRVLFVTGHPGDGKTHLLRRLAPALANSKVEVCLDANEHPDEELIATIERAAKSKRRGLAVAINEGILVQLLHQAAGKRWAQAAREQLLRPLHYRGRGEPIDERVVVVDLNLRNNLSEQVVQQALEALVNLSAPCDACPVATCPLQQNAARVAAAPVKRITALLDAVAQTGFHATMRDLQGFLSYLLSGDETCESVAQAPDKSPPRAYWHNAFEGGQGPLFDAVRRFDPKGQTHPLLDDKLWRHADRSEEWSLHWPTPSPRPLSRPDHLDEFIAQKRRALFEHSQGAELIRSGDSVDRTLREVTRPGAKAVRRLIALLNRFFDREMDSDSLLYLWMTHRYDANTARYATAAADVHYDQLELLRPTLRQGLDEAFPDFVPDHAILCGRDGDPALGLHIDRPLVAALVDAERGLPSLFQRDEPALRIETFINRLAKSFGDLSAQDEVSVHVVDRNGGGTATIAIDVTNRRYVRSRRRP